MASDSEGRKSRRTRKARRGFADPDYDLAIHWLEGRGAIERAGRAHDDPQGPARFLLINGASRSEHTCPGESSKSWRLLSRPYRNRRAPQRQRPGARSQPSGIGIWPSHISLQDLLFHITRTVSLALFKLMIDRLVCADGGNPDPTSTHGKDALAAKKIELDGRSYPRHLSGRRFACVVHGDAEGAEAAQRGGDSAPEPAPRRGRCMNPRLRTSLASPACDSCARRRLCHSSRVSRFLNSR